VQLRKRLQMVILCNHFDSHFLYNVAKVLSKLSFMEDDGGLIGRAF